MNKPKRIEFLRAKYKISNQEVFVKLLSSDPTKEKKYLEWLCKLYSKGKLNIEIESYSTISFILRKYHSIKNNLSPQEKDINKFNSIVDLSAFLVEFLVKNNTLEEKFLLNGAKKLYEDKNILIVKPFTIEAAIRYGKSTQWCTSAINNSHFYSYMSHGDIFMIINKNIKEGLANSKYQLFLSRDYDNNFEFRNAINSKLNIHDFFEKNSKTVEVLMQEELFLNCFSSKLIKFIENPTEEQQIKAVKDSYINLKYIKTPSIEVQLQAIKSNAKAFNFIKNPCEKIQIALCTKNGLYIKKIFDKNIEPSEKVKLLAIDRAPTSIKYISNPWPELQIKAVKKNANAIKQIKNPCEEAQIIAVKSKPNVLKEIKKPTREAQLEALKKGNAKLIYLIKNPNNTMKLIALKKDPFVIKKLDKITKAIAFEVAKTKDKILQFTSFEYTKKEQQILFDLNYKTFKYFDELTEEMQLMIVGKDFNNLKKIKTPTEKVKKLYNKKKKEFDKKKREEKKKLKNWLEKNQQNNYICDTYDKYDYKRFGQLDEWGNWR